MHDALADGLASRLSRLCASLLAGRSNTDECLRNNAAPRAIRRQVHKKLILLGEPIIFRVGSATLLGSFKVNNDYLVVELAQIEGGGEGVLVSLASLARRYAKLRVLLGVEWIVHAVSCAKPNLKLRRVLERRGFVIKDVPGVSEAYHLMDYLSDKQGPR